MSEGTARVLKPRPCPRVVWGVAVSMLAHAGLLVGLLWPVASPEGSRPQRMTIRLLSPPMAATTQAATTPPLRSRVERTPTAVPREPRRSAPAAPSVPPVPPAAIAAVSAPPEPISGAVFGLPTIGFPGLRSGSHSPSHTPPMTSVPPMPSMFAPQARMSAARDAGRAQIVDAMQQQAIGWQTPSDDGVCDLHSQPQPRLECTNDALQQIVVAQARVLSGLLDAYRSIDAGADHLAIAFAQGRYQVTPAQRIGASVSSMPRDVTVTAPGL